MSVEGISIPENIDNCIEYCITARMQDRTNPVRGAVAFCIEKSCTGPIISEQLVDISEYGVTDWQTTTDFSISCPAQGGGEEPSELASYLDGSPIAAVNSLTQEDLRERTKQRKTKGSR